MYNFVLRAHSEWRYLVILALVVVLVKYLLGWLGKREWTELDRRLGSITSIVVDIQLLMGLILWGIHAAQGSLGAHAVRTIEHPVTMLVAIVVMHVGFVRVRKAEVGSHFRMAFLTFAATGIIVSLGIAQVTGVLG